MRRVGRRSLMSLAWIAVFALAGSSFASGCAEPALPELPALCSDAACPDGLECIHGVCAPPGTPIPITVAELPSLKGRDLKLIPQPTTALVTWQTYAYSEAGERFVGARVSTSGEVSQQMTLVSSFDADGDANEPFYDVLSISDTELLLAVSAPPLAGDSDPSPRLITYSVKLPAEGQEASGAQFGSPWPSELRMSTIGYGAVSKPKLVKRGSSVELGYVQTLKTLSPNNEPLTSGELTVIKLEKDGTPVDNGVVSYAARSGLPVAVSVEGAFEGGETKGSAGGVFWALDDARPSVVFVDDMGAATEEKLERLSITLGAEGSSLLYLQPSLRTGEKLPSDPVTGEASLHSLTYSAGGGAGDLSGALIKSLPTIRDTPRPAWVARAGKPAILVTPGAEQSAPSLAIFAVDLATGSASQVAAVDRYSSSPVAGVAAAVVGGKLFVAWVDGEETAFVRTVILPEP